MEQRAIAECGCGIEEKARKAGKADSKAVSWRLEAILWDAAFSAVKQEGQELE
jgi:hypothetical protein